MAVGIALGVLVGFVSGAAFAVFLRGAFVTADPLKAGTSLLAMPTTWFGGGWLTTLFDISTILSSYVAALAITVVAIGAYPLSRVVIRIGHDIGSTA
jgi:hypothetical protein